MFIDERKEKILEILKLRNRVTVLELTEELDVSEATIRRDLHDLEGKDLLKRSHGGAILNSSSNFELSFSEKEVKNLDEKKYIASLAAEFVKENDVIIMDSGTTTILMIPFIQNKNITVITNSIVLSNLLAPFENITLYITGGQNRPITKALVGDFANSTLKKIHANKAFMGTNAFAFDFGFSTPNSEEAKTKSQMIKSADEIFFLVDYSKMNNYSMVKFADIKDIDYLVTDKKTSLDTLNKFENKNIRIVN